MINKISISLAILLAIAIGVIVYLMRGNEALVAEIEQSKGREEVYRKQKETLSTQIDSVNKVSKMWEARFDSMPKGQEVVIKYYEKKSNQIANLPLDSAVILLGSKLSKSVRH
jgi:uncharacterized membrane protein YraQ (UPF0718 family)